jgi:hypothetical protein
VPQQVELARHSAPKTIHMMFLIAVMPSGWGFGPPRRGVQRDSA